MAAVFKEDHGRGSHVYTKSRYRANQGRYSQRDVFDSNHKEAEELWGIGGSDHPMRQQKGTIAQLAATPYQIVKGSLPSATFKDGVMPRSYDMMSIGDDWEVQGADQQPAEMPYMESWMRAPMMNVQHLMPDRYKNQGAAEGSVQNLMQTGTKLRTQYAKGALDNAKYNDGKRTFTELHTINKSLGNFRTNRGLAGKPSESEYRQAQFEAGEKKGLAAVMDLDTAKQVGEFGMIARSQGLAAALASRQGAALAGKAGNMAGLNQYIKDKTGFDIPYDAAGSAAGAAYTRFTKKADGKADGKAK